MSRRKAGQARSDLEQAREVRLGYLSRNPEFRQNVTALENMHDALPGQEGDATTEHVAGLGLIVVRLKEFEAKWGIPMPGRLSLTLPPPVSAWTTIPTAPLDPNPPKPTPEESRFLNMRVD